MKTGWRLKHEIVRCALCNWEFERSVRKNGLVKVHCDRCNQKMNQKKIARGRYSRRERRVSLGDVGGVV
jgi:hypothetical protein